MSDPAAAGYLIRPATEDDLDAIVGFEIDIALVSFGDTAITDPALHRKRVSGALGKPGEITLVAVAATVPGVATVPGAVVGWAWLSARTNSLTGDRYGNFRSLAAAAGPDRSLIGELLLAAVVAAADDAGLRQLTGKVHAANLGMRTLYRKFGFEAAHLTMERRRPAGQDPD
jgi:ribosomal protein S18 acetylase RimI-like enzyme